MTQEPKQGCMFVSHLSLWQQEVLHNLIEAGIEEGKDVLQQHKTEIPHGGDVNDLEEYVHMVTMQKRRMSALYAMKAMLEEE
jgi:hypothetical protein